MKKAYHAKVIAILCLMILLLGINLYAEDSSQPANQASGQTAQDSYLPDETYLPFISDIIVSGNQIISSNTIISKIKTQKGKEVSREVINEDIKRLYATGYFQDVRFDLVPDGNNFKVMIVVDEKPVVKDILLSGNVSFKTEELMKDVTVKPGQILDQHALKESVQAIQQKYLNKGFKFAAVDSAVDVSQYTKEATVRITINEGKKFKIRHIQFEGVNAFKPRFLRRKMGTKTKALWRSGAFKEDKFKADLERIAFLYQREGYLDVTVRPQFDYDDASNTMAITMVIDEGAKYLAGTVRIKGNRLFPETEIWSELAMVPGSTYSQVNLQEDVDAIRRFYFERGYINARIVPEINLNKATGRVDVLYDITEGDLYYVDKVKIRGNAKTKDKVIRRELRIRPGERFDGEKLEKSKQRLNNLGFFEDVSYETEPGTAPDKRDVVFKVKEKQTGELSFGAGVSSIDQFIGFAEIAQRNFDLMKWPTFTGAGQNLSVRGRWGSVTRDLDFNFVEPYFLDYPVSFGINAYNWERESNNLDFDTRRRGIGLTFGRRFTDILRGTVGYTIENVKITNISSDAAPDVRASGETNTLSRMSAGMAYDTRDNVFNPHEGWYLSTSAELVGGFLFGDQDYYNLQAGATKFWSFKQDHVIEFRNKFGVTNDFGDSSQVPVFDRFFAGGLGTVRGYNYRRVGPKGGGDPIGGETMVLSSLEYTFPIVENFKGAVFIDAGHVNYDFFKVSLDEFAVSVGPGLKINTPLGPVTFYYGFPVANRDDKDKYGRFEFNLSRGF